MLSTRVFWRVFVLFVVTATAFVLCGVWICKPLSGASEAGEWSSWCWRWVVVFSGIIIVGAMVQITLPNLTVQILAAIAVLLASINVFGGFRVTARMLEMFKREEPAR